MLIDAGSGAGLNIWLIDARVSVVPAEAPPVRTPKSLFTDNEVTGENVRVEDVASPGAVSSCLNDVFTPPIVTTPLP